MDRQPCRLSARLVSLAFGVLLLLVNGFASSQDPWRIFVTSVTGTGDLSSWPGAQGNSGLAAADAICRARADIAGLANPANFVAWMSDSSNDAYCRVHGLSGLVSGNCGETYLPIYGGFWLRTDGLPFTGHIGDLVEPAAASAVLYPVLLNEFGNRNGSTYFTATDADGELSDASAATCSDWSAADSQMVAVGSPTRTTWSWSSYATSMCSSQRALLCIEIGGVGDLPPYHSGGAVAFVTSADWTGNLGSWPEAGGASGLAAGDAICQHLAADAGLDEPDGFKAWLSDGATDAIDRFTYDGPWIRVDGVRIADSLADLVDGELFSALNVKEDGKYLGNYRAWTGTSTSGVATGDHCDGWTSADGLDEGTQGIVNDSSEDWTEGSASSCSNSGQRLYCFSQTATVIFVDGFESAGSTAWSLSVGKQ
jgi:hypothetical protein